MRAASPRSRFAPTHAHARDQLNAEKAPFFVGKLAIKVLPTIVCFHEGVAKERLTGFEELGMNDEFKTEELEFVLAEKGAIHHGDGEFGDVGVTQEED